MRWHVQKTPEELRRAAEKEKNPFIRAMLKVEAELLEMSKSRGKQRI